MATQHFALWVSSGVKINKLLLVLCSVYFIPEEAQRAERCVAIVLRKGKSLQESNDVQNITTDLQNGALEMLYYTVIV